MMALNIKTACILMKKEINENNIKEGQATYTAEINNTPADSKSSS